jgi:hypothetical protein
MRDWFAAFAREQSKDQLETRATGATGATPALRHCETCDFDVAPDVAQAGNRWATRATPEPNDKAKWYAPAAGSKPVAPVAHPLPRGASGGATTEHEKHQVVTSADAHVAHVAHQIENDKAGDPARCAHCGGGERSGAPVFPIGTEVIGHTWLHTECWREWYTKRCAGGGGPPGEAR